MTVDPELILNSKCNNNFSLHEDEVSFEDPS